MLQQSITSTAEKGKSWSISHWGGKVINRWCWDVLNAFVLQASLKRRITKGHLVTRKMSSTRTCIRSRKKKDNRFLRWLYPVLLVLQDDYFQVQLIWNHLPCLTCLQLSFFPGWYLWEQPDMSFLEELVHFRSFPLHPCLSLPPLVPNHLFLPLGTEYCPCFVPEAVMRLALDEDMEHFGGQIKLSWNQNYK